LYLAERALSRHPDLFFLETVKIFVLWSLYWDIPCGVEYGSGMHMLLGVHSGNGYAGTGSPEPGPWAAACRLRGFILPGVPGSINYA